MAATDANSGVQIRSLTVEDLTKSTDLGSVLSPHSLSFVATGGLTRLSFSDASLSTSAADGFFSTT